MLQFNFFAQVAKASKIAPYTTIRSTRIHTLSSGQVSLCCGEEEKYTKHGLLYYSIGAGVASLSRSRCISLASLDECTVKAAMAQVREAIIFWSSMMMTIGGLPRPETNIELVFVTANMLLNVMMFAAVVGHISTLASSAIRQRTHFQRVRDSIKLFLQTRLIQP